MNIRTNIICTCWILITTVIMSGCSQIESGDKVTVGKSSRNLGNANVKMVGDRLTVGTGVVERQWKWTKKGFVTVSFTETKSAKEWADQAPVLDCDWKIPAVIDGNTEAKLLGVTARKADDEGFTSEHLEVVAQIRYPDAKVEAQFVIWAYPDAPGIRTQLRVKGVEGYIAPKETADMDGRVDYIPMTFENVARRTIGFIKDNSARDKLRDDMLVEDVQKGPVADIENCRWANVICIETDNEGMCLVKENPKAINKAQDPAKGKFPAYLDGEFHCSKDGLLTTGAGLTAGDILTSRYRTCWATWSIAWTGGNDECQLAIKKFDRYRYPVDDNDMYISSNTWGSTRVKQDGKRTARESNVLRQIKLCDDLGIDVMQIDDGWQDKNWLPDKKVYPDGWKNVRAEAEKRGVTPGLWASWAASEEALKENCDKGDFKYFKIDFYNFNSYENIEGLISKVRNLIKHSEHTVRVNWDTTGHRPRAGIYFAREYGNYWMENRKPYEPAHAVYIPHQVLRDVWQMSKYVNLNKIQIPIQNVEMVNPEASNAIKHRQDYATAIALMASPMFFQELQYLSEQAKDQIRPLLAVYKKHRPEIFSGYVFPIARKPDDKSWTGFQCHIFENNTGYLTIFRELQNAESKKQIKLKFLGGKIIKFKDLQSQKESILKVSDGGSVTFHIEKPADFRFYRYQQL